MWRPGEHSTFRANPAYTLVVLDRLSRHDREQLEKADGADDLYGALVPQDSALLEWRSVSCDTALLFLTLTEPGPLPRYVLRRLDDDDGAGNIKRLLLDGVLQMSLGGEFVCGPQAAEVFASHAPRVERGRKIDLAVSALRYAQELKGLSEAELGDRLYCYGRQPVSPQLHARFADSAAVARFLGIEDGPIAQSLDSRWSKLPPSPGMREYWSQWISTSEPPRGTSQRACYKLYVSPAIDDARTALEVIAGALPQARGVTGLKVGVGLDGICRPDKIVVYLTQLDDLYELAGVLRTRLSGCGAHGVPFTAAVSGDGLLSWGADPPSARGTRKTSWRMWVAWRLAEYLISAQTAVLSTLEPWQYALERLSLAGIDTETWIPANGMWPVALETA